MSQASRFYRVVKDYAVAYPNPIKLKSADAVSITKRETNPDWLGWVFCTSEEGVSGWVSEKCLEITGDNAIVINDYDATELKIVLGEIVEFRREEFGWAWVRNQQMKEGWVPRSHLAPSTYPPVRIRIAQSGDEGEIANVHLNSWREAYRGLLPAEFLDELPLTYKRRRDHWKTVIPQTEKFVLFVAEAPEGVVGFACFRQGVDKGWEITAELGAMYLLEKYKGCGVGFNLLSAGFKVMQARGFERGFCWVLKGNPTIGFYERSGAIFSGDVKDDLIGGQACTELRYEWKNLGFNDYNWEPLSIAEVTRELANLKCGWAVAGGWAIDLFIGTQTRTHSDVDILVARDDLRRLHDALPAWELWVSDPPGSLRPLVKGEELPEGIQDIWCRKLGSSAWQFQFMLFDVEDGKWVFKRDRTIRRPLNEVIMRDAKGTCFLAPEVQLLHKSRGLRAKDKQDFESVFPKLDSEQRSWLAARMTSVDPNHIWVARLRE